MFSIIQAAGWPIWPLVACSVFALALVIERFSSLKTRKVAPTRLMEEAMTVSRTAVPSPDVVAQLEKRAADSSQKLNWKTSIVDLLKLLDIDSGLADRKELAKELGCPAALMDDSAQMNIWLHKEVLARIAANGGNVPSNLLD